MKNDFSRGVDYAWNGVREFYKYRFLWKYTAIPLTLLFGLYGFVFFCICRYVQPYISAKMVQFFEGGFWDFLIAPLSGTLIFLSWVAAIILLALASNCIYETLGGFFFPFMVKEYEKRVLKIEAEPQKTEDVFRSFAASCGLALKIIILFMLLSLIVLFVPVFGFFIFLWIMGYQYSILFMSEACFNRRLRLSDIKYSFMKKNGLMYGFGIFSFFMIQLPFLSLLLYPGFVIGGTKMFHDEADVN